MREHSGVNMREQRGVNMPELSLDDRIANVRGFNRFITRKLGVLREGLLHSPYSPTESRIIYEIGTHDDLIAAELAKELGLHAGYLSRILEHLRQQGLIQKVRSEEDARRQLLCLTATGKKAFQLLDSRSRDEISDILNNLSEQEQNRLLQSMQTIQGLLGDGFKYSEPYILRQHEPGDMGWVTHLHGSLYAQEYGWDEHFEALVAQIVADFIKNYNPDKERCWIAEMDGQVVGSIFLVQSSDTVAKLRLLLVDPKARGLGLGTRLVDECIRFAKRKGYEEIVLWTNDVLVTARNIYQKAGFKLVEQEPHRSFGHDLVGETWSLSLQH